MNFDIGKIFENLVAFFVRLPLAQKIALPLLIAGSTGAIMFVARWAAEPEYQVLFSNLEDADAAAVVEYLKDHKIAYSLSGGGSTIQISPPSIVHETRLELTSAGLPKGGSKGFELFESTTLGATAQMEHFTGIRATQGELERTIMSIEAVRNARVHIVKPERSAFVKKDSLPTAAVLLRTKPGMELTPAQVKGIVHLVAGSIERLTPDNVTVMDSHGNLLTDKKDKEGLASGADLDRLEYQRQIESGYVKRIETMLAEILGPGKSVARVTAELDFSKFEKEEELYDPAGTVVRSERSIDENASKSAEGGVPGVSSNLTNDPSLLSPPDSGKAGNVRREAVRNFEVSRAVSRTAGAAGKILRLTVAVLADGQYVEVPGSEKDAEGKPVLIKQYKPLSADMIRKIDNLVKQSVGFDQNRGDVITVENIRFMADDTLEKAFAAAEPSMVERVVMPYVLPILGVTFFFLMVIRPLLRFLTTPTDSEIDLSRLLPAGMEELEAELDAERSKLSSMPELATPTVDIEELESLLADNSRIVRENPQQAALLIRYWLNDGRI